MKVSLNQEFEELVNVKVASGKYHSAAEVVHEGLRLLKERDELERIRLEELRREIAIGLEQANKGETAPLDVEAVKAEGRRQMALHGDNRYAARPPNAAGEPRPSRYLELRRREQHERGRLHP